MVQGTSLATRRHLVVFICNTTTFNPAFSSVYQRQSSARSHILQLMRCRATQSRIQHRPQPKPTNFGLHPYTAVVCRLMVSTLHPRDPYKYMDYYSITDPGEMEGWVGLVGWPQQTVYPQSGHLPATDQAQVMESPLVRDRHPNHWAMASIMIHTKKHFISCYQLIVHLHHTFYWL